jgi:hypothetical protein
MRLTARRLLPPIALLFAFAVGFWWMRRAPAPPPAVARAPVPAAVATAIELAAAPAPSPSPLRRTVRTETEVAPAGMLPEVGSISVTTARDYRHRARFPRSSQPIEDGVDPVARDREVTRGKSVGPEGTNPTLVVWPARTGFEAPNPIVLHAYLVRDERKVDPKEIRGEILTQQGGVLAGLDFRDDGMAGDATANDLVFTAVVAPGAERATDFKGAQLVDVEAELANGERRIATTGFLYSIPLAHLTGRYRDEIVDGSLVVSAEIDVHAAGRFHLEATLAAADGTPVGWAQNAQVFEAGTAWIPLTYWGLMFHERGVPGPYVLATVALSTTGEMPNQKNDVVVNAHRTAAYDVAAFSDRRFEDPDLVDAAARLEADAPAGALEAEPAR